jgi:hypothetical protein
LFVRPTFDLDVWFRFYSLISTIKPGEQLYLPETRDSPLLHTLTEGEEFGVGDTGFARLCGGNKSPLDNERVFETAASTANIIQLESQKE